MANIQSNNDVQEIVHFEDIYDNAMVEIEDNIVSETVDTERMVDIKFEATPEVECGEVVIVTDGQDGEGISNSYQEDDIDYSQLTELTDIDNDVSELSIPYSRQKELEAQLYEATKQLSEGSFSDESNIQNEDVDDIESVYVEPPKIRKKRGRPRGSLNKATKLAKLAKNTYHSPDQYSDVQEKLKKVTIKKEKLIPAKTESTLSSSDEYLYESELSYFDKYKRSRKEPKKRAFRHRLQWRDLDMLEALKSVQEMKTTIRGAAKQFAVPYSTLKDRVHGRVRHGTKPGVKTALSPEEEEELVRYVMDMQSAGFSLRYIDVRERAGELLRLNHGSNNPYGGNSPGHNWLAGFLKRHPGLEFRRPSNKSILPSIQKQKNMLGKFYDITTMVFKRQKILHKPDRIFCVSELRLCCGGLQSTILVTMAADGTLLPPFVVFSGTRLKLSPVSDCYPEATFNCSIDGHVNEDMFSWWFREHFLKHTNYKYISNNGTCRVIRKPMSLFVSRWVVDVTLSLSQKAKEERLSLICMPPGVAHLLQPLDDAIVNNIEMQLDKKIAKYLDATNESVIPHKAFAQILSKVWKKAITSEHIKLKYNRNGLFPLNPYAISNERISTANQLMAKAQMAADRQALEQNNNSDNGEDDDEEDIGGRNILNVLSSNNYQNSHHDILQEVSTNEMDYIEEALTNNGSLEVDKLQDSSSSNRAGNHRNNNNNTKSRSYHRHNYTASKPEALRLLQKRQREASDRTLELAANTDSGLHSQLHAARDNVQQTDLAINSILSTGSTTTSSVDGGVGGRKGTSTSCSSRDRKLNADSPCSSDTDDADETSWNIDQIKQQLSPAGDNIHFDDPFNDPNVIYEEDIAATVDISSSQHIPTTKKGHLKRGPKRKKKEKPTYQILENYNYADNEHTNTQQLYTEASSVNQIEEQQNHQSYINDYVANEEVVYEHENIQENILLDNQQETICNDHVEIQDNVIQEEIIYDQHTEYPSPEKAQIIDDSEYIHLNNMNSNSSNHQIQYINKANIKQENRQFEYVDTSEIKQEYHEVQYIDSSQIINDNYIVINSWNS